MQDWMIWMAFAVLVVAAVVASHFLEQRRTKALEQAALMSGLTFEREADLQQFPGLASVRLFRQGDSPQTRNLMRGSAAGCAACVFDFEYSQGEGKSIQTVAAFRLSRGSLPDFELRPENLLHKIGAAFGYQDIDFESHPQFSRRYLLRGGDEDAVRKLFDPGVLAFFEGLEREPAWWVEGGGPWLVAYRWGVELKPANLQGFLSESTSIANTLIERARKQATFGEDGGAQFGSPE